MHTVHDPDWIVIGSTCALLLIGLLIGLFGEKTTEAPTCQFCRCKLRRISAYLADGSTPATATHYCPVCKRQALPLYYVLAAVKPPPDPEI